MPLIQSIADLLDSPSIAAMLIRPSSSISIFAPVFSEIMNLFEISLAKIPNLYIALFLGFLWGSYASIKRSWV